MNSAEHTRNRDETISRRYLRGETARSLGEAFGLSEFTVHKILRRRGVPPHKQILTDAKHCDIRRRYEAGDQIKDIARAVGVAESTINRVLRRDGVERSRHPGIKAARWDDVCDRYRAGETVTSIARRYGAHKSTVAAILETNDVERRMGRPPTLTAAREQEMSDLYLAGGSPAVLSNRFGVSQETIRNSLRRRGISLRSRSEGLRRYALDQSFFDSIDSEEKAYTLGFIAADGCVYKNILKINLAERDREHLIRLRDALGSTHPVRKDAKKNQAELHIASDRLRDGLAAHGIIPRKTRVLRWPNTVPPGLLRHYLRGYADGDGCWSARRRKPTHSPTLNFCFVGNLAFCREAQRFMVNAASLNPTKILPYKHSPGIASVSYGGNKQVSRIWHLLYDGATVYLSRKRDVAAPYVA
jgi:Mor family transcriptional regulator/DNA-binding CsgD family transcriptional regulator